MQTIVVNPQDDTNVRIFDEIGELKVKGFFFYLLVCIFLFL